VLAELKAAGLAPETVDHGREPALVVARKVTRSEAPAAG